MADSRSVGPWHLGELRGARFERARTPSQQPMEPFEGTYTTAPHDLGEFATEEWMGERRRATVERLRRDEALGRMAPPVPEEANLASLPRHGRGHLPPNLEAYEPD
jgi:hypothetical protein